jgi:hypothetical protein
MRIRWTGFIVLVVLFLATAIVVTRYRFNFFWKPQPGVLGVVMIKEDAVNNVFSLSTHGIRHRRSTNMTAKQWLEPHPQPSTNSEWVVTRVYPLSAYPPPSHPRPVAPPIPDFPTNTLHRAITP